MRKFVIALVFILLVLLTIAPTYAQNNGWEYVGGTLNEADILTGADPQLALSPDGTLYAAWYELPGPQVKFWDGAEWIKAAPPVADTVPEAVAFGWLEFAILDDGTLVLGGINNGVLTLIAWTGEEWAVIGTQGNVFPFQIAAVPGGLLLTWRQYELAPI